MVENLQPPAAYTKDVRSVSTLCSKRRGDFRWQVEQGWDGAAMFYLALLFFCS
jgi:hypothetical protein